MTSVSGMDLLFMTAILSVWALTFIVFLYLIGKHLVRISEHLNSMTYEISKITHHLRG